MSRATSGIAAAAAVAVALALTACQPTEVSKQAEEVASVAAEGALLAHGAAEGTTTDTFAREHAKALRTLLGQVRGVIEDERLAGIAADVDAALGHLADDPGDEERAARVEADLDRANEAAEELAA